jgi:hypothetical protein
MGQTRKAQRVVAVGIYRECLPSFSFLLLLPSSIHSSGLPRLLSASAYLAACFRGNSNLLFDIEIIGQKGKPAEKEL